VKCFAGCDGDAVLGALRVARSDLAPLKPNGAYIEALYDYEDDRRTLLFQVVRYNPKRFAQRRPEPSRPSGVVWNTDGVRKVLFRLPRVLEAFARGEPIYVAEGEKDVLALERAGVTATCNPGGAGKWRPDFSEALRGARVIVVRDKDEVGRSHAASVKRSLTVVGASVTVVEAKGENHDAFDHLTAGASIEEFVEVQHAEPSPDPVSDAAPPEVIEVLAQDGTPVNDAARDEDRLYVSFAELLREPDALALPDPIIPRLAFIGRVTMLAAREKLGKSTLVSAGAAAVTRGGAFLDGACPKAPVLWVSADMEHRSDMLRRAVEFKTNAEQIYALEGWEAGPLARLEEAVKKLRPRLVIIDTLHPFAIACGLTDAASAAQYELVMRVFRRLAQQYELAVLLVHHGSKKDGKYRDSSNIGASVDAIFEMDKGGARDIRNIAARGRWGPEDFAVRLTAEDSFELLSSDGRPTAAEPDKSDECLAVLIALGAATKATWRKTAKLPESTFDRACEKLVEANRVVCDNPKKRGALYRPADGVTGSRRVHDPNDPQPTMGSTGSLPLRGDPLTPKAPGNLSYRVDKHGEPAM
jgi:hypothetical protein